MRHKNVTLFFEYFTQEHLGKDPFLVPYYLGKALGYSVTILYPQIDVNQDMPSEIRGVKMIGLPLYGDKASSFRKRYSSFYKYIWDNAKHIDILMRFFDIYQTREVSILYKFRNPRGRYYIKMDVDPMNMSAQTCVGSSFLRKVLVLMLDCLSKNCVDVISCETAMAYEKLMLSQSRWNRWGRKLVLMPNGFDEETFKELNIIDKSFSEKENVIITVGRLGTPPKNTSMLLKALETIDLKDWKFFLIGPIEDGFKTFIDNFFYSYPEKKNNVFFTGAIYDKKSLWEYYNRAKVFVFTSEWESFGLVLVEAKRFHNNILTTPVGAAYDILKNGKYGDLLINNDDKDLAEKLQKIISGKTNIDVYKDFDPMLLSYERLVKIVAERLDISDSRA